MTSSQGRGEKNVGEKLGKKEPGNSSVPGRHRGMKPGLDSRTRKKTGHQELNELSGL